MVKTYHLVVEAHSQEISPWGTDSLGDRRLKLEIPIEMSFQLNASPNKWGKLTLRTSMPPKGFLASVHVQKMFKWLNRSKLTLGTSLLSWRPHKQLVFARIEGRVGSGKEN